MIAVILLVSALLSAIVGAALVALSSRAHWTAVTGSPADQSVRRMNTGIGGALLLLTMVLAVMRDGGGMGLLLGHLLIASGIATVIAILAIRPRSLRLIATVSTINPWRRGR